MLQIYLGDKAHADAIRKKMDDFCKAQGLSKSSLIRRAIKKYIDNFVPNPYAIVNVKK